MIVLWVLMIILIKLPSDRIIYFTLIIIMKTKFTEEQIRNWRAYERVRTGGKYNMFDNRAIKSSGLTRPDYLFVMENYSELMAAHIKERKNI